MSGHCGLRQLACPKAWRRYAGFFVFTVVVITVYLYAAPSRTAIVLAPSEDILAVPLLAKESATTTDNNAAEATSEATSPVSGQTEGALLPITVSPFLAPVDVRLAQPVDPATGRANATFVMLARNSDVDGAVDAIRSLEEQFNGRRAAPYPWVFLNEQPFSDEFKLRVSAATRGQVQFGLVEAEEWYQPEWIDEERMEDGKKNIRNDPANIPYASSTSYRNMCRYNSGFFFKHELLAKYKWYWRVEPDVEFLCPMEFDPFEYMIEHNKRYAFVVSLEEYPGTVPSLWSTVKEFRAEYPNFISENNSLSFISGDDGDTYNLCHFWSNFEIADLDFFRSDAYAAYFSYLDATGGFYYERWGDAPVHSIAAALLLPRSQLHFFGEIGYYHLPFQHCPLWPDYPQLAMKCSCKRAPNLDSSSCMNKFRSLDPSNGRR